MTLNSHCVKLPLKSSGECLSLMMAEELGVKDQRLGTKCKILYGHLRVLGPRWAAGLPQQGTRWYQDLSSWQFILRNTSSLLPFADPISESLLPDHPREGGPRTAAAQTIGGIRVVAEAHRALVWESSTHHLLGLSVGSLHSCHPRLECLEAQDTPANPVTQLP